MFARRTKGRVHKTFNERQCHVTNIYTVEEKQKCHITFLPEKQKYHITSRSSKLS